MISALSFLKDFMGELATLISPLILLSAAAIILMLQSSTKKESLSPFKTAIISAIFSLITFALLQSNYDYNLIAVYGLLRIDPISALVTLILFLGLIFSIILTRATPFTHKLKSESDYYALLFLATVGAWLMLVANELITLFVGLEISSMALYVLCASHRSRASSVESAFKYLILGSFSSAFFLLGLAFYFGASGSLQLSPTVFSFAIAKENQTLLLLAIGILSLATAFKVALAPFHVWAADVYEGAPTALSAFMATSVKAISIIVLLKFFQPLLTLTGMQAEFAIGAFWLLAVLSMLVGNLLAVRQVKLKRLLAYSSVAHAGYVLLAFPALGSFANFSAIFFYLFIYLFLAFGAFAIVAILEDRLQKESLDISDISGLGKTYPALSLAFAIFMLGLAGLPPVFGGLLGKAMVFGSALSMGWYGAVFIGIVSALIGLSYYLKVIYQLFFVEQKAGLVTNLDNSDAFELKLAHALVVLCVFVVIFAGIFPSLILFPWLT